MTFPTIPTAAAGRVLTATGTTCATGQTFPDLSSLTKNAGDLLIAIVGIYDGNSTNAEFSAWGGGFTEFGDFAGTATAGIGCAYKWSTGAETGTFTVTSADTSTNDYYTILLSIPGAHATTPPEAGGFATFTAANGDPGNLDPSGWAAEDTLWIAVGLCGETSLTGSYTGMTSAPASYSDYASTGISADAIGAVSGAVAFRQLNASAEDPGAFSCDTSNTREAALVIAVRPAPAAQTLTQSSSFSNSNTLNYQHTVTPGEVALTQSSRFDNSNTLNYTHVISQGGAEQTLTQSATFTNSNDLSFSHTLSASIDLTQSATYGNSNTLNYQHTVTPGEVALSQSARFDNSNGLAYAHTISTEIALAQSARFDNSNGLAYAHTISTEIALAQSATASNSPSFYTHTVTPGEVSMAQSARFDNTVTFYAHDLAQDGGDQTLTQAATASNSPSFYAHTLTPGEVALAQSATASNSPAFYAHTVTPGEVALSQSARFDNDPIFYAHTLTQDGGAQTLTQAATYANNNGFYAHSLIVPLNATPGYGIATARRFAVGRQRNMSIAANRTFLIRSTPP